MDSDGKVVVHKKVDAEPVMEALKDYGDIITQANRRVANARMIGAVDPVTAEIWAKEAGLKIGTREFSAYARKKLADPDWSRFRLGGV